MQIFEELSCEKEKYLFNDFEINRHKSKNFKISNGTVH